MKPRLTGKRVTVLPALREIGGGKRMASDSYLKKHSEALVENVGIEAACTLTGRSKATLGQMFGRRRTWRPLHAHRRRGGA